MLRNKHGFYRALSIEALVEEIEDNEPDNIYLYPSSVLTDPEYKRMDSYCKSEEYSSDLSYMDRYILLLCIVEAEKTK